MKAFACTTCLMIIANGEGDPDWTEEQFAEHLMNMSIRNGNVPLFVGDSENDQEFSWSRCDTCGSTLGGARHEIVIGD